MTSGYKPAVTVLLSACLLVAAGATLGSAGEPAGSASALQLGGKQVVEHGTKTVSGPSLQADESGARLCRKPLALASALRKIHSVAQQNPMDANPATAHLFIVNPLSARGFVNLFSTHPPVERRVEILEGLARQL